MAKTDRIPNALPALMSDDRAAWFLDMSVSQFRAMVKAGHLPKGRKLTGSSMVRWRQEQLLAWINLEFGLPAKNASGPALVVDDEDEWGTAIRAA